MGPTTEEKQDLKAEKGKLRKQGKNQVQQQAEKQRDK